MMYNGSRKDIEKIIYKGYSPKIRYSWEDRLWNGKIKGINDLITFECESLDGIESAFQETVDDYLALCKENGWEPNKPKTVNNKGW